MKSELEDCKERRKEFSNSVKILRSDLTTMTKAKEKLERAVSDLDKDKFDLVQTPTEVVKDAPSDDSKKAELVEENSSPDAAKGVVAP